MLAGKLKISINATIIMNRYKRLLEFENNIALGKKFYREDLGF